MGEQVVKIRAELGNAVVVRPGDKLIVATGDRISTATADTIMGRLSRQLPGVEIIIVDSCTSLAVYRPGDHQVTG